MGEIVKITRFYDLSENSVMKQILMEHYGLILKHIGSIDKTPIDIQGLNQDVKEFYKKWHGDKSPFVKSLAKSLMSSAYSLMAEEIKMGFVDLEESKIDYSNIKNPEWENEKKLINRYYNQFWNGMKLLFNGREANSERVMDDSYFEFADQYVQELNRIDFRFLREFQCSMTISLVNEIERIWKTA